MLIVIYDLVYQNVDMPYTLLDMYLRTANFKQNVLAILGAFQK